MPGRSHQGALPSASTDEAVIEAELRGHIQTLAGDIGERNVDRPEALRAAAAYLENALRAYGYAVADQPFEARGLPVRNLEVELRGTRDAGAIVVVGAHYDSAPGTPGANDNGSGVAAALVLARRFARSPQGQTVRFVFWVNEEPPFFQTDLMGSVVYARRCRARSERITAMLSLETLGYYSDAPGTQAYPKAIRGDYPDRGNFVTFVANRASRDLVESTVATFRRTTAFPAEGLAAPEWIDGVGWSDHWAFWQEGFPGVMVTDTAPFRYRQYHKRTDTPDRVAYDRLARVVSGLGHVVTDLAR
ncbi:MAG TPA: M28 family peptidase [Polyangia bacterium]|nr:M28 family peptidase [Polyangia bacterium]